MGDQHVRQRLDYRLVGAGEVHVTELLIGLPMHRSVDSLCVFLAVANDIQRVVLTILHARTVCQSSTIV